MSEQVVEFIDLVNHTNYEILNKEPFTIRRKDNHHEIKETLDKTGYIILMLQDEDGRHKYSKHRLIAEQFLENPDNLPHVDHKNRIRTDNRLCNLRWCSRETNMKNKSSYSGCIHNYVEEIYPDSIMLETYGIHEFTNYYYDQTVDKIYYDTGEQYRELPVHITPDGYEMVNMLSVNKKKVKVFISKIKRIYGIK